MERERIHSLEEVGFYQQLINHNERDVTMVYHIFGNQFAAVRSSLACEAQYRHGKQQLPEVPPEMADLVRRIQERSGLHSFGVEFLGGQVIDVNYYPNPFFFPEASAYIIEGIFQCVTNGYQPVAAVAA